MTEKKASGIVNLLLNADRLRNNDQYRAIENDTELSKVAMKKAQEEMKRKHQELKNNLLNSPHREAVRRPVKFEDVYDNNVEKWTQSLIVSLGLQEKFADRSIEELINFSRTVRLSVGYDIALAYEQNFKQWTPVLSDMYDLYHATALCANNR